MKDFRWGWGLALTLLMTLGVATGASAQVRIGLVLDGSTANAESNIEYFVSQNPGYTFTTIPDVTALNALTVAELNATYDVLVVPWQITTEGDFDWDTRLLPYLTNGGSVLWEDPTNANDGDLASSGITLTEENIYPGMGTADISLVPPFDSNGAIGWYHIHFGIIGVTNPTWLTWSSDVNGGIHGVYAQFGAGRMIMGVSDNLYHPNMSDTSDPDYVGAYNLLRNELNWLRTGSVDGSGGAEAIPTLSEWAIGTLALILALLGIAAIRNRRLIVQR